MLIDKQVGICYQEHIIRQDIVRMIELLKAKGWYSGDRCYPIAHPSPSVPAIRAFLDTKNLWDESCPYCQRRIAIYKELMACSNAN